jgi:hypothetical protein
VPVLQPKDAANRFPDLVVLRQKHLELTQRRLTITLDMPPPRWIVEVVSPGQTSHDRDYLHKRAQYAAMGVPEYWLIDPVAQTVMVLTLEGEAYREVDVFGKPAAIASVEFAGLELTVARIFDTDSYTTCFKGILMTRIALVTWGYKPVPPLSNSIYTLIYEYRNLLNELGHEVDVIDEGDIDKAIDNINNGNFDFVHLHAYNFVDDFNRKLKQKYCFTCHYGYLLKEDRRDEGFQKADKTYIDIPGIITMSREARNFFTEKRCSKFVKIQPNGVNTNTIKFSQVGNHKAVCLDWIQTRNQQRLLTETIEGKLSLDFVGPSDDPDFTEGATTKYLGIWSLKRVYANLTDYNCLVLISDGEVASLVVLEPLAAGLCVAVSESASANLHTKDFIKILPDDILSNVNSEN